MNGILFIFVGGVVGTTLGTAMWMLATSYSEMGPGIVIVLQIPKFVIFGLPGLIVVYLLEAKRLTQLRSWWAAGLLGLLWAPLFASLMYLYKLSGSPQHPMIVVLCLWVLPPLTSGLLLRIV